MSRVRSSFVVAVRRFANHREIFLVVPGSRYPKDQPQALAAHLPFAIPYALKDFHFPLKHNPLFVFLQYKQVFQGCQLSHCLTFVNFLITSISKQTVFCISYRPTCTLKVHTMLLRHLPKTIPFKFSLWTTFSNVLS